MFLFSLVGEELLDAHARLLVSGRLSKGAKIWYDTWRQDNAHATLAEMMEALRVAYPENERRYLWMKELYDRTQKSDESVFQYASSVQELGRLSHCPADNMIVIFIRGLLPHIKERLEVNSYNNIELAKQAAIRIESVTTKYESNINMIKKEDKKITCFYCGKHGHFARNCWKKKNKYTKGKKGNEKLMKCFNCGNIGHKAVDCRMKDFDTGASHSIISKSFLDSLNIENRIIKTNFNICLATENSTNKCIGEVDIKIDILNESFTSKFLIVDELRYNVIIGIDILRKTNSIIDMSNSIISNKEGKKTKFFEVPKDALVNHFAKENLESLLKEYEDLFSDIKVAEVDPIKIELKPEVTPSN